jgi:hypothetical protein
MAVRQAIRDARSTHRGAAGLVRRRREAVRRGLRPRRVGHGVPVVKGDEVYAFALAAS